MGGGNYSYIESHMRGKDYQTKSREEIFSQRGLNSEMDIKNKVRESRDSDEHPESYPIIIALDVTGSMGSIPERLIKEGFPEIMKKIMESGIEHPQVCFLGIGDHYTDKAPLQVGQFETSDELLDKWLKLIWLEGGGGGNGGESYSLAWYFAAKKTSTDSWENRKVPGVLITIGDEPIHGSISSGAIKRIFGDEADTDAASSYLLQDASQMWDVYHINLSDYSGITQGVHNNLDRYKSLLNVIHTEGSSGNDIPDLIAGAIIKSYNSIRALKIRPTTVSVEDEKPIEHLR